MEKYHPGWLPRATGHVDSVLHVGLSSTLKMKERLPAHLHQALQPDQTSHIPHLVLPQGTCSDSSLAKNALFCSTNTSPRELPSYVFFEALIKFF